MGAGLSVFILSLFNGPESWSRFLTFQNILVRHRDLGLEPACPRDTCVGLGSNLSNTCVVVVVVVHRRRRRRRRRPSLKLATSKLSR